MIFTVKVVLTVGFFSLCVRVCRRGLHLPFYRGLFTEIREEFIVCKSIHFVVVTTREINRIVHPSKVTAPVVRRLAPSYARGLEIKVFFFFFSTRARETTHFETLADDRHSRLLRCLCACVCVCIGALVNDLTFMPDHGVCWILVVACASLNT